MKYDEFISKVRAVKAPDLDTRNKVRNLKPKQMESLVSQLKKVDRKTKLSIRFTQLLYIVMTGILTYYLINAENFQLQIGIGAIDVAFCLIILVQELRFRAYQYNYEDGPVIQSLKDAKSRMKVFTKRTWLVIPIWILIDIGVCFIVASVFPYPEYIDDIIILIQLVLIALIALDFYVAYLTWKRDQKPVLKEIDKMIEEIEES